jgi:hypothetical protein
MHTVRVRAVEKLPAARTRTHGHATRNLNVTVPGLELAGTGRTWLYRLPFFDDGTDQLLANKTYIGFVTLPYPRLLPPMAWL